MCFNRAPTKPQSYPEQFKVHTSTNDHAPIKPKSANPAPTSQHCPNHASVDYQVAEFLRDTAPKDRKGLRHWRRTSHEPLYMLCSFLCPCYLAHRTYFLPRKELLSVRSLFKFYSSISQLPGKDSATAETTLLASFPLITTLHVTGLIIIIFLCFSRGCDYLHSWIISC